MYNIYFMLCGFYMPKYVRGNNIVNIIPMIINRV